MSPITGLLPGRPTESLRPRLRRDRHDPVGRTSQIHRNPRTTPKRAGLCQLRDLLITTPEPLRSELRPLTRARLLQRLAATRPGGGRDPELRGSMLALRSLARRVLQLPLKSASSPARSKRSRADSPLSCSTSPASDPTPPHNS